MAVIKINTRMTGYTSPAPYVVTTSSQYNGGYWGWCAFDGTPGGWLTAEGATTGWIQIDLGTSYRVVGYDITTAVSGDGGAHAAAWNVQGSNDGTNFITLHTGSGGSSQLHFNFTNYVKYRYIRLNITSSTGPWSWTGVGEIYYYYDDVEITPLNITMTGYNSPSPYVVTASSEWSGYPAWKVFDKTANGWFTQDGVASGWVQIDLGTAYRVVGYDITTGLPGDSGTHAGTWNLQGSNDGTNFNVLHSIAGNTTSTLQHFNFSNDTEYRYIRFYAIGATGSYVWNGIGELGLYYDSHTFPDLTKIEPKMTAADTPSPYFITCSSQNPGYPAWQLFNNAANGWFMPDGTLTGWAQIDLGTPHIIRGYDITASLTADNNTHANGWTLQGSTNGTEFTTLHTVPVCNIGTLQHFTFENNTPYQYIRLNLTSKTGVSNWNGAGELALYRLSSEEIPDYIIDRIDTRMTGYNTPSPYVVTESSHYISGYYGWCAFDGAAAGWLTAEGQTTGWIQIDLSRPRIIVGYDITAESYGDGGSHASGWTIQGSNNGTDFTTLHTVTSNTIPTKQYFAITNTVAYRYVRFNATGRTGSYNWTGVGELYFYESLSTATHKTVSAEVATASCQLQDPTISITGALNNPQCLRFNGDTLSINTAGTLLSNPSVTGRLTIEFWANIQDGYYIIASGAQAGGAGIYFSYQNGTRILGLVGANDATWNAWGLTGIPIPLNEWHHYAIVWNGTTLSYYIDCVFQASTNATSWVTVSAGTTTYFGGTAPGAWTANLYMDEFRAWDHARTLDQLQQNYQRTLTGTEQGLKFYYRFDEGSGTTLYDSSSSGKNGTFSPGYEPIWSEGVIDLSPPGTNKTIAAEVSTASCQSYSPEKLDPKKVLSLTPKGKFVFSCKYTETGIQLNQSTTITNTGDKLVNSFRIAEIPGGPIIIVVGVLRANSGSEEASITVNSNAQIDAPAMEASSLFNECIVASLFAPDQPMAADISLNEPSITTTKNTTIRPLLTRFNYRFSTPNVFIGAIKYPPIAHASALSPEPTISSGTLMGDRKILVYDDYTRAITDDYTTPVYPDEHLYPSATLYPSSGTIVQIIDSSGEQPGFQAWKAFNNTTIDEEDCWSSPVDSNGGYIIFDMLSATLLNKYLIECPKLLTSDTTSAPKDWTLEGSNNKTSWVIIDRRIGESSWKYHETRVYTISYPGKYRYYRLNISATNGKNYVSVGELIFYKDTSLIKATSQLNPPSITVENLGSVSLSPSIARAFAKSDPSHITKGVSNPCYAMAQVHEPEIYYGSTISATTSLANATAQVAEFRKGRTISVDTQASASGQLLQPFKLSPPSYAARAGALLQKPTISTSREKVISAAEGTATADLLVPLIVKEPPDQYVSMDPLQCNAQAYPPLLTTDRTISIVPPTMTASSKIEDPRVYVAIGVVITVPGGMVAFATTRTVKLTTTRRVLTRISRILTVSYDIEGSGTYKGIDTDEERNAIEYNPKTKYTTKPPLISEKQLSEIQTREEISEDVTPMASAIDGIIKTKIRIEQLMNDCEQKLLAYVLIIDPKEFPHISEAIKNTCPENDIINGIIINDSKIDFNLYKKCLNSDTVYDKVVVEAYEEYVSGINGCAAGESYQLLHTMNNSYGNSKEFLFGLMESQRNDSSSSNDTDDSRLGKVIDQELIYKDKYDNRDDSSEIIEPLTQNIKDIANTSKLRTSLHQEVLDKMDWNINSTTADNYGSSTPDFIKKIVGENTSPELANQTFNKTNSIISKTKVLLAISISSNNQEGKFLDNNIKNYNSKDTASAQQKAMRASFDTKTHVSVPVLNWLDNNVSENESCGPLEQLAEVTMDAIELINKKHEDNITDNVNASQSETFFMHGRCENIAKTKWSRDTYNLLDMIQQGLESAKSWSTKGKTDQWVNEFIKANNLDTSYDSSSRAVKKIKY